MRALSSRWSAATLAGPAALCMLALGIMSGCEDPNVDNVTVQPDTFSVDEISEDNPFTISADITSFDNPITSVVADVESQDQVLLTQFPMTRQEDISDGQRWAFNDTLAAWSGFNVGTYNIRVTATDDQGNQGTSDSVPVTITSGSSGM